MKRQKRSKLVLSGPTVARDVAQAMAELKAKTEALDAIVHFRNAEWSLDQDTGLITFDHPGHRVMAPAQIIGTYNSADETWLWAWDHPSIDEPLQRDAKVLLEYGRKHGIEPLTTRKLACTEQDCWEFTALAVKLCNQQGAYRGPAGSALVFMTFGKVELSKG